MPLHPLAEVFGFPANNMDEDADRHRRNKLCPFNNRSANCTKSSITDPLGVCSVFYGDDVAITCPIRFRQDWIIADDAAAFFGFPAGEWTTLPEVRLKDKNGESAGNIDVVVVRYDNFGQIIDYGALEIQAVYISGNVGIPFKVYMSDPSRYQDMDWSKKANYPRPDYLSSSRKRLAPQLIFKGGILHKWGKKSAVALDKAFFETLPILDQVSPEEAEIAWLIYDLEHTAHTNRFRLVRHRTVYTMLSAALDKITKTKAGNPQDFVNTLQEKLSEKLNSASGSGVTDVEIDS